MLSPKKVWDILPQISEDLKTQLLYNRGLKTEKQINQFFNPDLDDYQKIITIPQIDKAWKRIQQAIDLQESIIVYGDYDVDGICASTIIYKSLSSLGAKIVPYIPHRDKEGYGLSKIGLDFARDSGVTLVITVDNGIVALEQARYAREIGLDLIITDHHLPLDEKPEAHSIVHSLEMCGAAVAWCLVKDKIKSNLVKELLQFVAIATIADMIPLTGLGRAFVNEGLKVLNRTDNLGLMSLINECTLNLGTITSYDIGHVISPRLNAIGRLAHAIDAVRLLCTKDSIKAKRLAKLLCDTNVERQTLTIKAIEEAKIRMDLTKNIQILESPDWPAGIIGLIAARMCEDCLRPAIAISINSEGMAKGSARSIKGLNIVDLIRQTSDILEDVGGHAGAAGFSLLEKDIPVFKKRLEELIDKTELNFVEQTLEIEVLVEAKKLNKSLVKVLEEFEPFGFMNSKPILATERLQISDLRTLSDGKHLKFKADGIDVIAFGMGEMISLLSNGQLVDLAYYLEINRFNGSEKLQLRAKDIRISE